MPSPNDPKQNHLLSTLLDAEFSRLAPHLELIPMLMGISLFMGGDTTPSRAVVQTSGHGYRLK